MWQLETDGGPLADFAAFPLSGPVSTTFQFFNYSLSASSYLWAFGDGPFGSTLTSPTHTYTLPGVYTVTLSASNGSATDTLTKTNYITVTAPITRNWQVITTTNPPPIIGEHAMTYDSDRNVVVLYGGNATGWPYETTTWELTGTTWLTTTDQGPPARYGAEAAFLPSEADVDNHRCADPDHRL